MIWMDGWVSSGRRYDMYGTEKMELNLSLCLLCSLICSFQIQLPSPSIITKVLKCITLYFDH